jgi:hypothetical protein
MFFLVRDRAVPVSVDEASIGGSVTMTVCNGTDSAVVLPMAPPSCTGATL